MDPMQYFLEIYAALPIAGPGANAHTRQAYSMVPNAPDAPKILDLGCGPGRQTIELLKLSGGTVVALDFLPTMLERTKAAAREGQVEGRLETTQQDMTQMNFAADSFDIIWSEGAIYNLGFENGLSKLQSLVRPGGTIAVTEVVWKTPNPPQQIVDFWQQYPEIDTVENKLKIIEKLGYQNAGHFVLPDSAWLEGYYTPMQALLHEKAKEWASIPEAMNVIAEAQHEIDMFKKHSDHYGYAFFIMTRP